MGHVLEELTYSKARILKRSIQCLELADGCVLHMASLIKLLLEEGHIYHTVQMINEVFIEQGKR